MASSSSLQQLEEKLKEAANRLMPQNCVDQLINQLDKLEKLLSMVPQAPCSSMRDALIPATSALVSDELLIHADMEVKVSVLSCITEISRISAPEPPYDDDKMKRIFQLTMVAFGKLSDVCGHCYSKAIQILNIVSKVQSSLLMQDLECHDLIVDMFKLFLDIIRVDHPSDVFFNMESIMTLVIEESDEISFQLLSPLLSSAKRENQNVSPIARILGEKVLNNCSAVLKTRLPQIVESAGLDLNDYAEIVRSICRGEKERTVGEELGPEPDVTRNEETVPSVNRQSKPVKDNGTKSKRKNNTLGKKVSSKTSKRSQERKEEEISNARTEHEAVEAKETVQPEPQAVEAEETIQPETAPGIPNKRDRKPNSRLKPEEGYDDFWFGNRRKSQGKKKCSMKNDVDENGNIPTSFNSEELVFLKEKASKSEEDVALKEDFEAERDGKANCRKRSRKNKEKSTDPSGVVVKKEDEILSDSQGKEESLVRTEDDEKQKAAEIIDKCVTEESGDKKLDSASLNNEESLLNESSKRKRKRKSTPAKKQDSVTVCGIKDYGEELVGFRIKVWWPLDQVFYEGAITSFDPIDKKHKVLYLDGVHELLDLNLERWQLLGKMSPDQEEAENLETPAAALSDKPRSKKAKTKPESSIKQELMVSSTKRSKTKSSKPASNSTPGTIFINDDDETVEIDSPLENDAHKSTGEQENDTLESVMKPKDGTTRIVFKCKGSIHGDFGTSSSDKANRENKPSEEKASGDNVETKSSSKRKKRQRSVDV